MTPAVIGRDVELAAVHEFLGTHAKLPAGLVLKGEAGIDKTTLWQYGLAQAGAGYETMACQATASQSELGFVAPADLLYERARELLSELAVPQRGRSTMSIAKCVAVGHTKVYDCWGRWQPLAIGGKEGQDDTSRSSGGDQEAC